jgi:beta-ribofuranosylaminobenzene 5'-phosphate synthase
MNKNGYRINGGIGFSINAPTMNLKFALSEEIIINDKREKKFTEEELDRLQVTLKNIKEHNNKFFTGVSCTIESEILPRFGLGSNTSIYLSCIEALFLLNNVTYSKEEIIALSKRGGTSGIGINTYFDGGFIFDVGIKDENDALEPSSIADRKGKKPLVIYRGKLPDWKVGICIPRHLREKSEQEEIDFFKKYCPIEKTYVGDILYESIYGVTSAIIEHDYNIFCKSINTIQKTQWKYLERSLYGTDIIELEQKIKQLGADCVGMSSLGPSLFFLGENIDKIIESLREEMMGIECYSSKLNNQGRLITYA